MYSLVLSLGHNSSAILVKKGIILCGYENERLSKIKSDSAFPIQAITEIGKFYDLKLVRDIYVSHWETFGDIDKMTLKHWNRQWVEMNFPDVPIHSHQDGLTHHDAHFHAAKAWAKEDYKWCIVADGFGNYNEVMSIYKDDQLIHRSFGFDKSIGLLYQYTTAYLGMKMNQDEYKLLGYEAHIHEYASQKEYSRLRVAALHLSEKYFKAIIKGNLNPKYDLVAGIDALPQFRLQITKILDEFCNKFKIKYANDFTRRVYIATYVQLTTEFILLTLTHHFGITEALLTGGIFMNVKLNKAMSHNLERVSIYPICGDQGAGLGVYEFHNDNLVFPDHLFWGKRQDTAYLNIPQLWNVEIESEEDLIDGILDNLYSNNIVNIVRGDMEFGARALGNTSTLALPTRENVEYINMLNGRDTIMPMAGMVIPSQLDEYIVPNIGQSLEYMIVTIIRKHENIPGDILGCHHLDPHDNRYTNRIQLVPENSMFGRIIKEVGMIINTSFNRHGVPIVFSGEDVVATHMYQIERDIENRMITLVLNR